MTDEPMPGTWLDRCSDEWLEQYAAAIRERLARLEHLIATRRAEARQARPTRARPYDPRRGRP